MRIVKIWVKQRYHIHDLRVQPIPIHTFYTVRKLRGEKKASEKKTYEMKEIWHSACLTEEIAPRARKLSSGSSDISLELLPALDHRAHQQSSLYTAPLTVTRQSNNSENKDHMSSNLWNSSLPVYARTARSLMLLHQLSVLREVGDFLFLMSA